MKNKTKSTYLKVGAFIILKMKEIQIVIKKILNKENGKVIGVGFNIDGKLYSHEESSELLYKSGLEVLFEQANNYSYCTDEKGNPSYTI